MKRSPLGIDLPARHTEHREMLISGEICPDCGSRLNPDIVCKACGLEAHRELVRVRVGEWQDVTFHQTQALMIGGPRHAHTWLIPPHTLQNVSTVQVPLPPSASWDLGGDLSPHFDTINYRFRVCGFYEKLRGTLLRREAVLTCLSDSDTAEVLCASHRWSLYTPQGYGNLHEHYRNPTLHGNAVAAGAKSAFGARVWRRLSFIGVEYAIPLEHVTILLRFSWEFLGMADSRPDAEEAYDKVVRKRLGEAMGSVYSSGLCMSLRDAAPCESKPFIVLS